MAAPRTFSLPIHPTRSKFFNFFSDLCCLDIRSLALFRITLSSAILFDLLRRWRDLSPHYTDLGLLPRTELLRLFPEYARGCLYMHSGSAAWAHFLFALTFLFASLFLVGYRTIYANVILWLLVLSLHSRNPLILNGGDELLRLALFWCQFLPMGACASFDRALSLKESQATQKIFLTGTLGYFIQVALFFEWSAKSPGIYYGRFAEALIPFILLCPVWNSIARGIAIGLAILLYFFGMFFFKSGYFPIVALVALTPLIPSDFWNFLMKKNAKTVTGPVLIYYDDDCRFCKKSVYLLREILFMRQIQIFPSVKDASVHTELEKRHSWIISRKGKLYSRFEAFIVLVETSPVWRFAAPFLKTRLVSGLGGRIYLWVSHHRPQSSIALRPFKFRNQNFKIPVWAQWLGLFFAVMVVWWNLAQMGIAAQVPPPLSKMMFVMRLGQNHERT